MDTKKIDKAKKILQPIKYEAFEFGYFVMKNDCDDGGSDFCINCIDEAVENAKKYHHEKRAEILDKYKQIAETGYLKRGRKKILVKGKYSDNQILKSKRSELKEYRANVKFTYEGHDPDFGGGLHEPCSCENCGSPFVCNFTPDDDEAKHLSHIVNLNKPLSDRDKWELDIAFRNYQYTKDDVKIILDKVANKIINRKHK